MENNPHSRREERPEIQEPYPFMCRGCDKKHVTTHENTRFVTHERQPWFDHIEVDCDSENYATVRFTNDDESREWAEQFEGRPRIYGTQQIREVFKTVYKIEDVPEYELTPGHESRIEKFGRTLMAMPSEHIQDEFSLPMPPRKLNEYWPEKE